MSKIKINKICEECLKQKGFDQRGCYGTDCNDACCKYGCDVDKEAYELIKKNRKLIEELTERKFSQLFSGTFVADPEYPGGSYIRSKKNKITGYCVFHKKDEKGCLLYSLVINGKFPSKMIPLICKLYPIEWDKGAFKVDKLEINTCNIFRKDNKTKKSIMETQKEVLDEFFDY